MSIPRPEYPRPQVQRPDWLCLNGEWEFEIDHGDSGLSRGLRERALTERITVPFPPESPLSGVGYTDFMEAVWYRRVVDLPAAWAGRRVRLHFQAVDYDTTVWVNDVEVARHRGGFTPFFADLHGVAAPGEQAVIVIRARDSRHVTKPGGKQSNHQHDYKGCHYARVTGIWQTVWLEPLPERHLRRPRITPDVAAGAFHVVAPLSGNPPGGRLRATLRIGDRTVATAETAADRDLAPSLTLAIPAADLRLWSPTDPHLYDLDLALLGADGTVLDAVQSYAGLRGITIDGYRLLINGEPVFQRLVLDQGWYPEGLMTAPTDAALVQDIELSMAAGFNGARLHQKVFEERFLYHADRLGYLCWGEFGDWGLRGPVNDGWRNQPFAAAMRQWAEALERDFSHPSIIGWCPLNETRQKIEDFLTALDDVTHGLYLMTKAADPTRPVLDSSGYAHRVPGADVWDDHDYDQDPESFDRHRDGLAENRPYVHNPGTDVPYSGQPYFCSEFGGIRWNEKKAESSESWGYGNAPKTLEEFYTRFERLCRVQLANPRLFGYCYTQLTDVFQEQNGVVYFDRSLKFDLARLHAAQTGSGR